MSFADNRQPITASYEYQVGDYAAKNQDMNLRDLFANQPGRAGDLSFKVEYYTWAFPRT